MRRAVMTTFGRLGPLAALLACTGGLLAQGVAPSRFVIESQNNPPSTAAPVASSHAASTGSGAPVGNTVVGNGAAAVRPQTVPATNRPPSAWSDAPATGTSAQLQGSQSPNAANATGAAGASQQGAASRFSSGLQVQPTPTSSGTAANTQPFAPPLLTSESSPLGFGASPSASPGAAEETSSTSGFSNRLRGSRFADANDAQAVAADSSPPAAAPAGSGELASQPRRTFQPQPFNTPPQDAHDHAHSPQPATGGSGAPSLTLQPPLSSTLPSKSGGEADNPASPQSPFVRVQPPRADEAESSGGAAHRHSSDANWPAADNGTDVAGSPPGLFNAGTLAGADHNRPAEYREPVESSATQAHRFAAATTGGSSGESQAGHAHDSGATNAAGRDDDASDADKESSSGQAGPATETPKPWLPLMASLIGLFASLGGNLYLGWIAFESHVRYRRLLVEGEFEEDEEPERPREGRGRDSSRRG